ncbi:hypothetical protein MKW98_022851 [Papaver atlanticum]|uniref:Glutaredoxin domain-containing protein n=1 Tax=Papaver atlanticum TaxID=357466 RepID=A0AAD4XYS0_9MAGN|nr:hypothetical protein MKW98_022851 [Papaver atlanticum]
MGCASSSTKKSSSRCRHCQNPLSRSHSMPIHHPAQRKGDSYHLVALTSTTLGSLKLDSIDHHHLDGITFSGSYQDEYDNRNYENGEGKIDEFSKEVIQAKTWSNMIEEKIPKAISRTPIRTPPGEPETINSWELMEGLEDENSPLRLPPNLLNRCVSYHGSTNYSSKLVDQEEQHLQKTQEVYEPTTPTLQENGSASPKPIWLEHEDIDANSNSKIVAEDFDPEMISTLRKALEELSPNNTVINPKTPPENEKMVNSLFSKKASNAVAPAKCPPDGENKVVIYFTSLRGVRKTYEDCCNVRVILKGFGYRLDERDVSMHSGFRDELKELLGSEYRGVLPRVFVKGDYIGGNEEVKQLHEDGELEKLLRGCDIDDGVCEACGDVRFVPCERCSGSCKIYYEEEGATDYDDEFDSEDREECEEDGGGFQRCPDCNENGIVRCPVCCY